MTEAFSDRPTTVADYLAIIRRRKWIVLVPPVVAAAAAFALSTGQSPLYQASAQVLVNTRNVVTALTGRPAGDDPTRYLQTQASIGRAPELAARVAAASGIPGMTAGRVLSESQVTPSGDSDLVGISVEDGDQQAAVRLANTYADNSRSSARSGLRITSTRPSPCCKRGSSLSPPKGKPTRLSTRRSFSSKVNSQ